jgi:hypothetical protein
MKIVEEIWTGGSLTSECNHFVFLPGVAYALSVWLTCIFGSGLTIPSFFPFFLSSFLPFLRSQILNNLVAFKSRN